MQEKYRNKLEYYKILEIVSNFCKTYIGKDICLHLLPSNNKDVVYKLLEETTQAVCVSFRKGNLPITWVPNIDSWIHVLEKEGSLSIKALLEVTFILKLSKDLKDYFFSEDDISTDEFTILMQLFTNLYTNENVQTTIYNKILDEHTIDDRASKKLYDIRRNIKNYEKSVKEKLNSIIHSSKYSKYMQEPIITIKNDRFVIPIKEEFRTMLKGFIHDISSSGSTVFIEPLDVFEINNQINNLKIEEQNEIENILQELSSLFHPITNEIKNNMFLIGKLDFVFAKAAYSKSIDAICPNINEKKQIRLFQARHPLIEKDKVVPIDITLGNDFSCLIITGPNTGGKTVTLKTVGLLQTMALSGLHIPANEKSSIYIFDHIYADIGDDQSIAESLSTFSSHMLNIIDILKNSSQESLILLDELGSGTDPIEGSSLAISILEKLYHNGSLILATTHYKELKDYALTTTGFENASSEFDVESLKPTYKLLIGVPGKSNAFSISKKLGISEDILKRANSLIHEDHTNIEELLKSIHDTKQTIEQQELKISNERKELETLKKELENKNLDIKQKLDTDINNAKIEARNILLDAKQEANQIIKQMNEIYENNDTQSIKDLNNLRNKLNQSIKKTSPNMKKEYIEHKNNVNINDLKVGSSVYINNLNQEGIVLSLLNRSNEVRVQIGTLKINIPIANIQLFNSSPNIKKDQNKKSSINIYKSSNIISKDIITEINVIGYNVEEANFAIDKFLDNASISKLKNVSIVHGKGTGKLRQGVHTFLKTHPHVKSFRIGTYGEGEMGVTIVELK